MYNISLAKDMLQLNNGKNFILFYENEYLKESNSPTDLDGMGKFMCLGKCKSDHTIEVEN